VRVFIADDSVVVRERLIDLLSELEGIEIIGQAQDGSEAVTSIMKLKPDVVILDIRMPGENGINVLRSIREEASAVNDDKRAVYHPAIIILTNYPYPQYQKKCLDLGADFFLDKSSEFEKVIDVLRQFRDKPSSQED